MITHLLVLLDKSAPSFCYYQHDCQVPELMPSHILADTINYAKTNNLFVTFLLGKQPLPTEYEEILDTIDHVKIVPLSLADTYKDAIVVLEGRYGQSGKELPDDPRRQVIFRLSREQLPRMAESLRSFIDKCGRVDLYPVDMEHYVENDIREYSGQLKQAAELVATEYKLGHAMEVNLISDRMLLQEMNNCNAGVTHCTAAPDGRLYICPGFYYDDSERCAVGSVTSGLDIKNDQLLTLEHAPICSKCDAYHCKRCVYLNKKITMEWNTPSRQQCVLAHLERNAGKSVQEELLEMEPFSDLPRIPAIGYLDPLLVVTGQVEGVKNGQKQSCQRTEDLPLKLVQAEKLDNRELLIHIFRMQREILYKLEGLSAGDRQ